MSWQELRQAVFATLNLFFRRDPTEIKIDHVYQVSDLQIDPAGDPLDVLCRLHYFAHKDELLHKAWRSGPLAIEGVPMQLFPCLG